MINGLIFGKFAPLTLGHIELIDRAISHCDHLYLFLSFDQKFVDTQPVWIREKLSLVNRLRDLKDLVRDANDNVRDKITVLYVDESDIPGYPEGAKAYEGLIRNALPEGVVLHKAFSSEKEYDVYFSAHFPECEHVVIDPDRNVVPISATKIRNDVFNNFNMLSPPAKQRFVKKVAIVGVESTGKTTLAINLAKHYNARYTSEIGRTICEEDYHSSEFLMNRADYLNIALDHRQVEEWHVRQSEVGVTFSDTTNLITQFSAICAGKIGVIDPTFEALSKEEGDNFYDLVLYLQPDVPWVADPLRLQDTAEKREETNFILDRMIKHSYNRVHVVKISGSDFTERTADAIRAVEALLSGTLPEIE
ncbi:putative NadR transcriptional regulator / nicotinamide-nucleotide adenylyltransferase [Erwinia phage Hena1]|uniref:Putative NadR transcriptional regulator / nicotinamide-nucleotide adenylyltransferase n=1 Tax=Erwinia phage Hena1 TaxID=2678601 RepID=A0A6B9J6B2_9CAUD|nr:nicotinamide-nucleotide adenylyltransferase [Erwinia phage Hena1]QGZ16328.1 putative NadR transcriptional regulator / nicotinamide-nucleotide adenylyltransferase [Erwinia phage Hena1]